MADRWSAQAQLDHLHQRYFGTGSADTTKWEWGNNIRRDSLASHIGHHSRLVYMGMVENKSLSRMKSEMLWKMVQPCGPPPPQKGL